MITEKQIAEYLNRFGFKRSLLGYKYMISAINIAIQDPYAIEQVTKILYPAIAKMYNTTSSRAERAMRHSIETCYTYANMYAKKMTNSEFIATAVYYFKYKEK